MEFGLTRFTSLVQGPDEDGRFDVAIPVSRELIGLLTEGSGSEGMFSGVIPPPRFTRRTVPRFMFLVVDNTRMCTRAADRLFTEFVRFADKHQCVAAPITLNYERRRFLFDKGWIGVELTHETDTQYPWNLMDMFIICHADTEEEADEILKRM